MKLLERFLVRGTVEYAGVAAGRMRRVRIACRELSWTPGQQVRLHLGGVRGPRRTYSVWDLDARALELRILDHGGEGPGARWARTVRPGEQVLFGRPEGGFVTRPARYHLFVGEETATAAFGPMMAALDPSETVYGLVEVDTENDRLPLPRQVCWRFRHGAPAASSRGLVAAIRALDLPGRPGVAYVAGEARAVQAVRRHLVDDRGWPRRSVVTKPFWTPGRTGPE
ncbi:siderophore-interacting protein [Streptomyces sp. NPDC048636]|uniref:siderophore-interacting protein n=1 Tax=Streptomyces sp. NPDC048636 TaxID=3155762 RepID=UPI0034333A5D